MTRRAPVPIEIQPTGPGELRRLMGLAWPMIVSQLGIILMGTVDVAMVGALSGDALAAVGVGHIWSFGVLIAGFGVIGGLDPLFSQQWGAGDRDGAGPLLAQACVLAALLSVPLTALHWYAEPALRALGQPEEVLPQAAAYCRAVAWGVPPIMVFQALARYLQGRGEMKVPMGAILVGNGVNLGGNALLVFGFTVPGLLTVPALGALGCGIATSLVRWAMLGALCFLSWSLLSELPRPGWRQVASPRAQGRLLAAGGPVGVQYGLEVWAFSATGLLMGLLGSEAIAGHAVAINLISITFMVPFGLGAAAATRIGNLVGARLPWSRAAWTAVAAGVAWMAVTATLLALFPEALARLYTRDAAVVALAASLLPVAATFQLFDGVQAVTFGVLRGAGDTRLPALANLFGYWCLGLPVAWWMGVHEGPSPRWVWGGLVIGLVVVASLLLIRLSVLVRRPVAELAAQVDDATPVVAARPPAEG